MKNEIKIEYKQIKATKAEIEARLFSALSMLISEDDLYEPTEIASKTKPPINGGLGETTIGG